MEKQVRQFEDLGDFKHFPKDVMLMIFKLLPIESINAFTLVNHAARALMNHNDRGAKKLKAYFPLEYEYFHGENLLGKNNYLLFKACMAKLASTLDKNFDPKYKSTITAVFENDPDALDTALEAMGKVTFSEKLELLCPFYQIHHVGHLLCAAQKNNLIYWAFKWKRNKIIEYFKDLVDKTYQNMVEPSGEYFYHKILAAKTKEDVQALQQQGFSLMKNGLITSAIILAQFDRADLLKIFIELGCELSLSRGNHSCNIIDTACRFESINVLRILIEQNLLNELPIIDFTNSTLYSAAIHPLILQELFNVFRERLHKDYRLPTFYFKHYTHHPVEVMTELDKHNLLSQDAKDSCLMIVANTGQVALARRLMTLGANPNCFDFNLPHFLKYGNEPYYASQLKTNRTTPLITASKSGQKRVVQALLEGGADPNHRNKKKETASDLTKNDEIRNLLNDADIPFLIRKLRKQLNELENGKADELVPDNAFESDEMRDMIAQTSVYLSEKKLTLWQWIKGLFTHPFITIRQYKHWKKAKTEMKNIKHAWLNDQASNNKEEKVVVPEDEQDQELNASKKMARRFTTSYMIRKLGKSHIDVFFGHGFGLYNDLDDRTKKQFKTIEKNIRTTFTGKPGKRNKASRKAEKAQIWRHAQGLFSKPYDNLGALAKAKAELLEAEVKLYQ